MLNRVLSLSRNQKRLVFLIFDVLALVITCWLSFALRYGEWDAMGFAHWPAYLIAPLVALPVFVRLGLYRAVTRYIGPHALWTVVKAVSLFVLIWAAVTYLIGFDMRVPRSVLPIYWFIALVVIGGSRLLARWLLLQQFPGGLHRLATTDRVIIYGAGSAGRQLATALESSSELSAVAFVDDNPALAGLEVHGLVIYPPQQLEQLIDRFEVAEVLLAMPSADRSRRRELLTLLETLPVKVLTLPGLSDIASGKVALSDIREIEIADVLGREEVAPYPQLMAANIHAQVVMVTGAGGSIGAELCRQIVSQQPRRLVLFDSSEYALYQIEQELTPLCVAGGVELVGVLGSVIEQPLLERTLRHYQVATLYHAAAYKHVPIVERNMVVGVRNNLLGTRAVAQAAQATGVKNFVLISSDKAVRPTNVMGATKRCAELVLQALAAEPGHGTRFAIVRFGNVLGSSGSVIPLFRQQIVAGGPVTVTHPEMTRYFMTIPEAAALVIQAGAMAQSGDVFVLDMGKPVKIREMAEQMIRLAGFSVNDKACPGGDIGIEYTGLRDGEKLYEELLIGEDVTGTPHPMIMKASEERLSLAQLQPVLQQIEACCDAYDCEGIRALLLRHVSGYQPQHDIRDALHKPAQLH
ncbi:polysaccharide biosynthesis protein [Marinobacterium rhizophilum]|uniref:Polysaccharide biosynthesis protein n=1 Tax=Marinobacterium rhizophilum TaxID=420402 RepID=A0ABY5HP58_9GAMM|nr:nucleoside-diphosphate sugar epimerase/dehydratase [Marinobacterium rhizophilum]UTW14247.1 polysaccharide biosynthesis protein [Marinobacterium rhizophilum]